MVLFIICLFPWFVDFGVVFEFPLLCDVIRTKLTSQKSFNVYTPRNGMEREMWRSDSTRVFGAKLFCSLELLPLAFIIFSLLSYFWVNGTSPWLSLPDEILFKFVVLLYNTCFGPKTGNKQSGIALREN